MLTISLLAASLDVSSDLLSLLDTHGLRQFVLIATRCSSRLDVVIANRTTRRLQQLAFLITTW